MALKKKALKFIVNALSTKISVLAMQQRICSNFVVCVVTQLTLVKRRQMQ